MTGSITQIKIFELRSLVDALKFSCVQNSFDTQSKTCSGTRRAEVFEHVVVATAAGKRIADAVRVRLEDHAGIIFKIANQAQVESDFICDAVNFQQAINLCQVVDCFAGAVVVGD